MKQKQKTLVLLLGLLGLLLLAFVGVTLLNREEEPSPQGTIQLLAIPANTVQGLTYTGGNETVAARLDEKGQWYLAEDPAYHLNQTPLNSMLTALADYTAKRQLSTDQSLAVYGLEKPLMTVTANTTNGDVTLLIGNQNTATGDYYVMLQGTAQVYTVASGKATCFFYGKTDLFGPFSPAGVSGDNIAALEIVQRTETVLLERRLEDGKDENGSDIKVSAWYLPDGTRADQSLAGSVLSASLGAQALGQITVPGVLSDYGLDDPEAVLKATTFDGEQVTLRFAAGRDAWYFAVEGDGSIYRCSESALQPLLHTAADYAQN